MEEHALRVAALAALGSFADARARRVLEIGTLTLAPIARRWGGSEGEISAHAVLLGLDAGTLGAFRGSPYAADEATAALAAALAESKGHTLDALRPFWAFEERAEGPYRGLVRVDVDRNDAAQVTRAARDYLVGRGEEGVAASLQAVSCRRAGSIWHVLATLTLCAHAAVEATERCLEDLVTGSEGDQVYVRCAP